MPRPKNTSRQQAPPAPLAHAQAQPNNLASHLRELISAAFTAVWVQTSEPHEAVREITDLCRQEGWRIGTWNCDSGVQFPVEQIALPGVTEPRDPLEVIRALPQISQGSGTTVLLLENLHRFLGSVELVQAVAKQAINGKNNRAFMIVLAPNSQMPVELEKLFVCLDHALPDHAQLEAIAREVATQDGELPAGEELQRVIDAAKGLTRNEAENAYSLSLVRHGRLQPDTLWEIKAGQLKKSGLVSIHRGDEKFDQLGGLENIKAFCLRALRRQGDSNSDRRPRGVLLLSPPGCGKSQFAKALGNETGRPTVVLDIGSLLGSLVGQSESNVRAALKLADAMEPCIVFCDEIEKGLAGATSSGQTDSGVTARVFGGLLSWLSDHRSDVFFIGTSNDISKLPPEFARSERFDGTFFIDLPGKKQRDDIWGIYIRQYGLDATQAKPDDTGWTGAEIKSCCRLASLLDVPLLQAAQNVVPVSVTARDKVEQLRQWASGRVLSADQPGIYTRDAEPPGSSRVRRVMREPGVN